jgi:S-DNA-T family DNA segregation ATPase FtsK/SpoIIIE
MTVSESNNNTNKSDKRLQEIGGIIILLFALLLFISIASFDPMDYKRLIQNRGVSNFIGPIGALLSHWSRSAFGMVSYLIVVMTAVTGIEFIKKGSLYSSLEKISSLFFLTVVFSALSEMILPENPYFSGGYIGTYLYGVFFALFGRLGSILLVSILCFAGLILLGLISVSGIYSSAGSLREVIKNYRKKNSGIPFNKISEALKNRDKNSKPWIEKKTLLIYKDGKKRYKDDSDPARPQITIPYPLHPDTANAPEPESYIPISRESAVSNHNDTISPENPPEPVTAEFIPEVPAEEKEQSRVNQYPPDIIEAQTGNNQHESNADSGTESYDPIILTNRITAILPDQNDEQPEDPASADQDIAADETENAVDTAIDFVSENQVFSKISLKSAYTIPTGFLFSSTPMDSETWKIEIQKNSVLLVNTLSDFGIESRVTAVNRGPVITLYEMQIAPGIKLNKVTGLADDIAMALAAYRVRIVAPIPGKSAIGIEIPNRDRESVTLGDIIKSDEFTSYTGNLKVVLGKDILGRPLMIDLKRMPHLLIAGATGSGKSVCVNTLITSLIYNYDPNYVRFIMVDPKMVELQLYNGLPHLLTPVITDPGLAPAALKWAMQEMERRYKLLSALNTRDIERYNQKISQIKGEYEPLPYIVTIIDELADLMMVAPKEIEGYITRIAQKARAVGIHLVLATQRPSVDVITGIIKANFPARIAFQVAQKTDSRTIIDQNGAEKLLGKGDMLYQSPTSSFPVRIQGAFISEDEIMSIVEHLMRLGKPDYITIDEPDTDEDNLSGDNSDDDELFLDALKIVEETRKASASYLQRRLSIGYNRAARIIELMEERGYVGPQQGSKPRDVYI